MLFKKLNIWHLNSFLISAVVAIPILTVFSSFFQSTGKYSQIIKNTVPIGMATIADIKNEFKYQILNFLNNILPLYCYVLATQRG